ncbi:MAG TPA: lipopolysaccharide core heptose(I) kinase RfaP [Hyphomicrobiales bacterium]|nr:lipopolysaccharide core heptose(I) kinase RfaP [Hyphomicrobiales bacterium]
MAELILRAPFATHWRGRDAFAEAFAVQGEEHRALEQRQTLSFVLEGKRYFIKRHRGASWGEILKNLLLGRLPVVSAHNEWQAIARLGAVGVNTPLAVAYGRRGLVPSRLQSFLVTEDVGPHCTLEDYCRDWSHNPPSPREKWQLIREVAQVTRLMHGAGIAHRDYYLCHLLKVEGKAGLTVIDLHRALCKRSLRQRWIIKDLAGLYFSSLAIGLTQRDYLRFIHDYTAQPLKQAIADAGFWREVEARGMKTLRREQRKAA